MENSIGLKSPLRFQLLFQILQLLLPVVIGILVVALLFARDFDLNTLQTVQIGIRSIVYIALACMLMLLRDYIMIIRFRLLTDGVLTFRQATNVHLLSEFTSIITPAAVGGSSLVVLFLKKEGINAGRSTTILFVNLFLDELFFLIACPLVFLFIPLNQLFNSSSLIVSTFGYVFTALYVARLIWTIILYIGIFRKPEWIKWMLTALFALPGLRRFSHKVQHLTSNLIQASVEMRDKGTAYWTKAIAMTFGTWTARFLVVNMILMAFNPATIDHLVVFARQLILWVYMVVSPTPGGSGVAEYAFREYYKDVFSSGSVILLVTVIWRFISYYAYFLAGFIVLPSWIKKSFTK